MVWLVVLPLRAEPAQESSRASASVASSSTLTAFMKIQADNCVPFDFVVPSSMPWDKDVWGYELGKEVNLARAQAEVLKKEYPNRLQMLVNMEFM